MKNGNNTMHNESQIEQAILRYLNKFGFAFKVPDQRRHKMAFMIAGISDIIFIYRGQVLFVEVKTLKGRQSEFQTKFQAKIEQNGAKYILIRSVDEAHQLITSLEAQICP